MVSKRGVTSALLVLLVVVLAGCSSIVPGTGPATPPVDLGQGALAVSVELHELLNENIKAPAVDATLTRGSTTIRGRLPIEDGVAAALFQGLTAAPWEVALSVDTGDGAGLGGELHRQVDIAVGETASLHVEARWDGERIWLDIVEEGDGDDGDGGITDPGTEPGDGDDDKDEPDPDEPRIIRDVFHIQSGNRTETRTEVYVIRSSVPGPTVMVVGGVHGGETSGWIVAGEVARTWDVDRGTLVVLPEANKDAVRRRLRTGRDGRDLNRAFPFGRAINQPADWLLAREIWNVVEQFRPVALIDLHEGWGLREADDRFRGGTLSVGQTIITYPVGDAEQFADHVIRVLNRDHNPFYGVGGYTYNFRKIGPPVQGSLAYKAGRDLRIPAFIVEPTQGRAGRHQTTVEQRSKWHRVVVEEFLRWYGLLD